VRCRHLCTYRQRCGHFTANPGQVWDQDIAQYFGTNLTAAYTIGVIHALQLEHDTRGYLTDGFAFDLHDAERRLNQYVCRRFAFDNADAYVAGAIRRATIGPWRIEHVIYVDSHPLVQAICLGAILALSENMSIRAGHFNVTRNAKGRNCRSTIPIESESESGAASRGSALDIAMHM
jgi:hypothetical protein